MVYPALNNQVPRSVVIGNSTRGPYTLQDVSGTSIRVRLGSHLEIRRYSSTTDETGTALVLNTDYTINNTNVDSVTVTLTSAQEVLTSSQRLVIGRKQTIPDVLSLAQGANFSGPALADSISVLTERQQELRKDVDRAIKIDWRETTERALPLPPTTGSAYLYRNSDGSIGQGAALTLSDADPSWSDLLSGDMPFNYPPNVVGDGVYGYSGVATAASTTFTDSNAAFIAADVGKPIIIKQAGAARYRVTALAINAAGSGYVVGEWFTGTTGTGHKFRGRVRTVGGSGDVTGIELRVRGRYSVSPGTTGLATTATLAGTGLTVNVTLSTDYFPHRTTIAAVNLPTSITLAVAPTTSVASSADYLYGTNDGAAIRAALAAGKSLDFDPDRVYCFDYLKLPNDAISSQYTKVPRSLAGANGTSTLACIGGGDDDYAIAPERWTAGDPNIAFTTSPWAIRNLLIDGQELVDRTVVAEGFMWAVNDCIIRGGKLSGLEVTRTNEDNTAGSSSYQSDGRFTGNLFDGGELYQMRSVGTPSSSTDSTTDGWLTANTFDGAAGADYGLWLSNGGGWAVEGGNRTYSHGIAGGYMEMASRGFLFGQNNLDGNGTSPGFIFGAVGAYPDTVIGSNDKWYANAVFDFAADSTTETIIVFGDHFSTQQAGTPDAQAIHNSNRSEKTLLIISSQSEASSIYARGTGNTLGIIEGVNVTQRSSSSFPQIASFLDDPSATAGPRVPLVRRSDSPVSSDDLAVVEFVGSNDAGTDKIYAAVRGSILTPAAPSAAGILRLQTRVGDTLDTRANVRSGLSVGSGAADGGAGSVNVESDYQVDAAIVIDAAAGIRLPSYTSTALNAIANAVNTANKAAGKTVWNSTASKLVTAVGSTAGSVWVDGAGTTVNTPV